MNHIIYIFILLSFVMCTNKNKFEEYQQLIELYPRRFVNENTLTLYNPNKEYIIRLCSSREGGGLEIIDLSKLDLDGKIGKLKMYKSENVMSQIDNGLRDLRYLNEYVHEAIDNYVKYGEEFYLIR